MGPQNRKDVHLCDGQSWHKVSANKRDAKQKCYTSIKPNNDLPLLFIDLLIVVMSFMCWCGEEARLFCIEIDANM